MSRQLPLAFDQEQIRLLRTILNHIDQSTMIKDLVQLYLTFMRMENKEVTEDENPI